MKTQNKKHIKQTIFLLVAVLVLSCDKANDLESYTKSNNAETTSHNYHPTITNKVSSQDNTVAISQRAILQAILDANPQSTLNWNLEMTKVLGDLAGVTINTQGYITELDLNDKELSVFPKEIGQLTSLTKLSAVGNSLYELPVEIWNLVNLKHLNLSSNQLTSIPNEIQHLINLKTLNLNYNGMIAIPEEIGLLKNLEEIGLFEK